MNWNERFELAKAYYEHYGHLRIKRSFKTKDGYTYNEEGFELGIWIIRQRQQYKKRETTPEHYEKLKSIGMIFDDINKLDWENFYNLAQIYLEHHGELPISKDFKTKNGYEYDKDSKNLTAWFKTQRYNYNHDLLSEERKQKIVLLLQIAEQKKEEKRINFELEWDRMYELAKMYHQHYGHLNIPISFSTNNGYEQDEKGQNLGEWIRTQRYLYKTKKLDKEKINKLEQIKMVFSDVIGTEWNRMYELAKAYYQHHGHLKVPRNFQTKNGYEYDKDGSKLGSWVNTQYCRKLDGRITQEEYQKLLLIGMVFENQRGTHWDKMYALAKAYYEHHGNLNVPQQFQTKNGYEYDEEGQNLEIWINLQRKYYLNGKLSKAHIRQLIEIGMVFENLKDSQWNKIYDLAKAYYEHYKSLRVHIDFKTKNGYEYDPEGENLGIWISRQRLCYRNGDLSAERVRKLQLIGMFFESLQDKEWNEMYALAVAYYQYHHNLKTPTNFRTKNGYEYDTEGKNLGSWVGAQRTAYKTQKLSSERITKLQIIGMVFEVKTNKEKNQKACSSYDIDYHKHKRAIDAIPHREFIAKINYLNIQGIDFVTGNQLHPIFFTSSVNMEVRYGISLEKMIQEYQPSITKVKRG